MRGCFDDVAIYVVRVVTACSTGISPQYLAVAPTRRQRWWDGETHLRDGGCRGCATPRRGLRACVCQYFLRACSLVYLHKHTNTPQHTHTHAGDLCLPNLHATHTHTRYTLHPTNAYARRRLWPFMNPIPSSSTSRAFLEHILKSPLTVT